jgi:hypothetical protein
VSESTSSVPKEFKYIVCTGFYNDGLVHLHRGVMWRGPGICPSVLINYRFSVVDMILESIELRECLLREWSVEQVADLLLVNRFCQCDVFVYDKGIKLMELGM